MHFIDSIGRQVHSYSRAGLMTADEWTLISRAFLDHLGSLPLSTPTPETEAVLADAAEAAAAAVSFTAYYPHERFHVFLNYVNFGMSYEPEADADPAPLTARRWIDALCLAILTDTVDRHGEAFYFTWEGMAEPDDLATGLFSQVANDDEIDLPADSPASPGLQALHALSAADRPAFDAALATLLHSTDAPLPLLPLALSALAYRSHRWLPSPGADRLPHALVTNFEPPVRGPVTWPVRLDRPTPPLPLHPGTEARYETSVQEVLDAAPDAHDLAEALSRQALLFRIRSSQSPDATDTQLADVRRASRIGAALFRTALDQPDITADVIGAGHWHLALDFALITGVREDLAPVVLAGPTRAGADRSAYAAYRRALHDYFRAADPTAATEQALREAALADEQGFPPVPVALLAQLVDGDESGFDHALPAFLEAHRDHYSVADRPTEPSAAINLEALALACHARRRGWAVRVESPYLPARLLPVLDHGR